MKKLLKIALITAVLIQVFCCFAFAAEIVESGTCSGGEMNWYFDSEGTLTFSGDAKCIYIGDGPYVKGWSGLHPWPFGQLKKVIIPEGVESIGRYVFYKQGVTEVVFPSTLKTIGGLAFFNTGIRELNLPEGLEVIELGAFSNCGGFDVVRLPDSVKIVEESAFSRDALDELYIGKNLTWLGGDNLYKNSKVTIHPENKYFEMIDGVLYEGYDGKYSKLIWASKDAARRIVVPDTINEVMESAFNGNTSVEQIIFPEELDHALIGGYAFYDMPNLTYVNIPKGVYNIRAEAFGRCPNLVVDMVVPEGCFIGSHCFTNSGIKSLTIEDGEKGLKIIDDGVASSCPNLKYVYLPATLTQLYQWAFEHLPADFKIYYGGTEEQWKALTAGNTKLDGIPVYCNSKAPAVKGGVPELPASAPGGGVGGFKDVKTTDYFVKPVLWAVENGITSGTSKETFSPNANCTRGQIITFLWIACGKPDVLDGRESTMWNDVKPKDYYCKAANWAAWHDIEHCDGPKTKFNPSAPCTRAMAMEFIWKACYCRENPNSKEINFTDVPKNASYYKAVRWAVDEGITGGTSATTFSPNATCTRAQIMTFLWAAREFFPNNAIF